MNFSRFANNPRLDYFDGAAKTFFRAALIAHLCGEILFLCEGADDAGLVNGLHEGLLAKTMLSHFHRANGGDSVVVIGNGNGHGVDASAKFIEQLSIILELFNLWKFCLKLVGLPREVVFINVANGHDIRAAAGGVAAIAVAFAVDADASDVNAVVCAQDIADVWK